MDTHDMASTPDHAEWLTDQLRAGDVPGAARHADDPPRQRGQGGDAADAAEMLAARATGPSGSSALWGLGLLMGAAAMYLLDAENGERRRAALTRRVEQYRDEMERTIGREGERALEQLRGTAREALRRVRESMVPDDTILREVTARMEDVLPFEEAAQIHVRVRSGRVGLDGGIAEDRLNRLLGRVATVPGVRGLDNRLVVRPSTTSRRGDGPAAEDPPQTGTL